MRALCLVGDVRPYRAGARLPSGGDHMKRFRLWTAVPNGCGSVLRGDGSREGLIKLTGRAPMWAPLSKGWSCQQDSLTDALALAQSLGIDVNIVGPRSRKAHLSDVLDAAPAPRWGEQAVPGFGRW